jgi:hypothetical protein
MYSGNEQESSDLRYVKENIERIDRTLAEYKKKLDFESKEQQNRTEQLKRRQRTDMQKLEAILSRQLTAFRDATARTTQGLENAVRGAESDMQHLQAQLEAARQKYEREMAEKQPDRHTRETADQGFQHTSETLRIKNQMEQISRRLQNNKMRLVQAKNENEKKIATFMRGQKREIEKLQAQHDRDKNSFTDTWARAKTYLENKIRETGLMVERFKNEYKTKEREFEIEKRRRQKAESAHRAQHGTDDARKNFAKPGKQNSIDPKDDSSAGSARRQSAPRW